MTQEVVLEFSRVLNMTGKNGEDGVSVVGFRADGRDFYVQLSNETEMGPYLLPEGLQGLPGSDGAPGSPGSDGLPGLGIKSASINGSNELILTLDNDSTINAGTIATLQGLPGSDGAPGSDGSDGVSITGFRIDAANFYVQLSNATEQGPYALPQGLPGSDGAPGADGVSVTGFRVEGSDFYVQLSDTSEQGPYALPAGTGGGEAVEDELGSIRFYASAESRPGYELCEGGNLLASNYTALDAENILPVVNVGDPQMYENSVTYTKSELLTANVIDFLQVGDKFIGMTDAPDGTYYKFSTIDEQWEVLTTGHQLIASDSRAQMAVSGDSFYYMSVNGDLIEVNLDTTVDVTAITSSILDASVTLGESGIMYVAVLKAGEVLEAYESADYSSFVLKGTAWSDPGETETIGVHEFDGELILFSAANGQIFDGSNFNPWYGFTDLRAVSIEDGIMHVMTVSYRQAFRAVFDSEYIGHSTSLHTFAKGVAVIVDEYNTIYVDHGNAGNMQWAGFISLPEAAGRYYNIGVDVINTNGDQLTVATPDVAAEKLLLLPNIFISDAKAYMKVS